MKKIIFTLVLLTIIISGCAYNQQTGKIFQKSNIVAVHETCTDAYCLEEPCENTCMKFVLCEDGRFTWDTRLIGMISSELAQDIKNSNEQLNMMGNAGMQLTEKANIIQREGWFYQYQGEFDACDYLALPKNIQLFTLTKTEFNYNK